MTFIPTSPQPQHIESAEYMWDLIQNCLEILEISPEEALGVWSLLAAIFHLGFADVKKGESVAVPAQGEPCNCSC